MVCIRKDKFAVKVKAKKSFGFLAGSALCLRLDIIAGTDQVVGLAYVKLELACKASPGRYLILKIYY